MHNYLNDEIALYKDFIEEVDIAKFIIQAYSGPFHILRERPDIKYIGERIKNEYLQNHQLVRTQEIFQQISDKCSRVHITPFLRKYKSAKLLAELFLQNFDFYSDEYILPIDDQKINLFLSQINGYNIEIIKNLLKKYNDEGFVPHHSETYKNNVHPSYLIILNDVIKGNITIL
uniref:Uncharacterized protein n=1 Tax=candidate division WOR-3 bacterium TaxID=2052148 RepID=A0A7C3J5B4_UNCW3